MFRERELRLPVLLHGRHHRGRPLEPEGQHGALPYAVLQELRRQVPQHPGHQG